MTLDRSIGPKGTKVSLKTASTRFNRSILGLAIGTGIGYLATVVAEPHKRYGVILPSELCVQTVYQANGEKITYVVDTTGPTGEYNLRSVGLLSKPQAMHIRSMDRSTIQYLNHETAVSAPHHSRLHTYTAQSFETLASEASQAIQNGSPRINCLSEY